MKKRLFLDVALVLWTLVCCDDSVEEVWGGGEPAVDVDRYRMAAHLSPGGLELHLPSLLNV